MYRLFRIILIFLTSFSSSANSSKLLKEYLLNNTEINKEKTTIEIARLEKDSVLAKRYWGLTFSSTYDRNKLDSTSNFSTNDSTTNEYSLGVNRDFVWGGHFSLDNTISKTKRGTTNLFSPFSTINEFEQSISYTQDLGKNLFGRDDKKEIQLNLNQYKFSELRSNDTIELKLANFYTVYLNARLNKATVNLFGKALERAKRRVTLINKKVKDGLREKVDLYQAQMERQTQTESLRTAEISLVTSIESISSALGRAITQSEIDEYNLTNFKLPKIDFVDNEKNNAIQALEWRVKSLEQSLQRTKYSFTPDISFTTSYSTNDFDAQQSETISRGNLLEDQNELTLLLSVSLPLETKPLKVDRALKRSYLGVSELDLKQAKINYKFKKKSLKEQIEKTDENIVSIGKKYRLAKKVLKEYNRLYNRGRADLDSVIRAEEDLIRTERDFFNFLTLRENKRVALLHLQSLVLQEIIKN